MERDIIIDSLIQDYGNYLEELTQEELDRIISGGCFTLKEIE